MSEPDRHPADDLAIEEARKALDILNAKENGAENLSFPITGREKAARVFLQQALASTDNLGKFYSQARHAGMALDASNEIDPRPDNERKDLLHCEHVALLRDQQYTKLTDQDLEQYPAIKNFRDQQADRQRTNFQDRARANYLKAKERTQKEREQERDKGHERS